MKIFSKNSVAQERFEFHIDPNSDKYKNVPVTIFNDYPATPNELSLNPINILILNEPNEFFGLHDFAIHNRNNFSLILTWSDKVHKACPFNSIKFIHGETNLDKLYLETYNQNPKREFEVTFLSGILNLIEGHKLRQRVLKKESEIKIPHKWWEKLDDFDSRGQRPGYFEVKMTSTGNPIEGEGKKQVWDRHSMFHVAIENSKYENLFTDKILDCFATKTLPIYWGAPNIDEFYNKNGIIFFNNENDLVDIINNLTEEDYFSRLDAINENFKLVKEKGFFFDRVEQFLDELIKVNNLQNENKI